MPDSNFEEVYRMYFKDVFLYMRALCHDENISEEIAQETFVKALKNINRFDGKKDIRAWLFTIAKNTYFTYCRKKNISIDDVPETSVTDIILTERIENEEQAMLIHKLLHEMDEPYKEVFQLRVFGELPFREIGSIFGKTETWARVTYHRARIMIKERMEES